jgi:hypothetical protein
VVYTSYEMIRDCRANRAEGWSYFLKQYAGVMRALLAHYVSTPDRGGPLIKRVLPALAKPESGLFQSLEPAPERWFVAELRQHVLEAVESHGASDTPPSVLDLELLTAALEPLTLTEKLAVWLESMRYSDADVGRMLRMSVETAANMRTRAADLVRGAVDHWSRTLLADSGRTLGRAAASVTTKDCVSAKVFLDVIDGRATWRGREEMERHVKSCWHCIDHYARLLEVVDVLRVSQPLPASELESYQKLLHIQSPPRPFWKRLAGNA